MKDNCHQRTERASRRPNVPASREIRKSRVMDYEWETVVKKGGEADMTMAMHRPVTIMKEEENPAIYTDR